MNGNLAQILGLVKPFEGTAVTGAHAAVFTLTIDGNVRVPQSGRREAALTSGDYGRTWFEPRRHDVPIALQRDTHMITLATKAEWIDLAYGFS